MEEMNEDSVWFVSYTCSCGLSTATIEYSCPSVCASVCVSVCVHVTQKIKGELT